MSNVSTPGRVDLDAVAREIKSAIDSARSIPTFTSRVAGFDLAVAYEVMHRVHALHLAEGARAVGRKIGFTNYKMWERYGVKHPIWAYVYDHTVEYVDGGHARCSVAGMVEPKIEPEIIVCFRESPRPGSDAQGILDAIEWIAHGFEMVQSHYPGWSFEAPDTVADRSLHARLFIGTPQPVAKLGAGAVRALADFEVDLLREGQHVETGRGANVLGSPLLALADLATVIAEQGYEAVKPGEIVTTGTLTAAMPVAAGETWSSTIRGAPLPGLEIEFTR